MPSGPQIPTPTPSDLSGEITDDLALYQEKFRRRLPESLDDLCGPARGVVDLPLRIAWSGMTSYDLGKPRQRMGLYRTVLHESLRDDLPRYLNHDLFLQLWPVAHGDHHASSAACPLYVGLPVRMPSSGAGVVKDALTEPQVDSLREVAASQRASPYLMISAWVRVRDVSPGGRRRRSADQRWRLRLPRPDRIARLSRRSVPS